jgi:hypothetical protein
MVQNKASAVEEGNISKQNYQLSQKWAFMSEKGEGGDLVMLRFVE